MTAIAAEGLRVARGERVVLDGVDLAVPWGSVTGFLGVNGAGKSTTIHRLLGLVRGPGTVRIAGVETARLVNPARVVGVAFDALLADPGQTAAQHLAQLAARAGVARARVPALLADVGLEGDGGRPRRIAAMSLGMRRRLAIASALVGSPRVLVLDEPLDGLDPEGRRWLRDLVRSHADRGGAVLLSAHGLDEIASTLDRVAVLEAGRIRFAGSTEGLLAMLEPHLVVRSPDAAALAHALRAVGAQVAVAERDVLAVRAIDASTVARVALAAEILVVELRPESTSLTDAFLAVTGRA